MKNVIVVGAGASGLVSAITLARRNYNVTILERNNTIGKKIIVSGNGKCNYWNSDFNINKFNSSRIDILEKILLNKDKVLPFFDKLGIVPKLRNGYYYPYSNQSLTILNVLESELNKLGVKVLTNCEVISIKKENNLFKVKTNEEELISDYLVMSTGSYSYFKNKTNGYNILGTLGHNIIKPLPALVQLKCDDKNMKEWAGIRADVNIKLFENEKYVKEESGELQFTNYGISGICAMQLSGYIKRGIEEGNKYYVKVNLFNIYDNKNEFIDWLKNQSLKTNKNISEILDCILNYKLTNIILKKCNIDKSDKLDNLTKNKIDELATNIIEYRINILDTNSYEESQVCSGGIPLTEINSDTFESNIVKNLYITGEILDADGACGGYNLGFAWISGIVAGESIGKNND